MATERATVIVTGSSGLIGSAVIPRLAERRMVVGFDEGSPPCPPSASSRWPAWRRRPGW